MKKVIVTNAYVDATAEVTAKPLSVEWKKPKISYKLWSQIVSFFKASYKLNKSEANVRLYINRLTGEWAAWAYPQYAEGLSVIEIEDHPKKDEDLLQFGDDWLQMGTMHHHCAIGASQSGTDYKDEIDQEGFHLTVGYVNREEVTTHCRFSLQKAFYSVDIEDFIETPDISDVPENIKNKVSQLLLHNTEATEFPQAWIDNIFEKPKTQSSFALVPSTDDMPYNKKYEEILDLIQERLNGIYNFNDYRVIQICKVANVDIDLLRKYFDECQAEEESVKDEAERLAKTGEYEAEDAFDRFNSGAGFFRN